jgi:serine/threonine-protein kinase
MDTPRAMSEPSEPSDSPPSSLVGQVISERYRVDAVLGTGGMGAVYRAEHLLMHKRVALKVLHPEMTRVPEVVARFEREAMAAAHIEHPNVASATDFGKLADGSFFLVLEFVEGMSLRDLLEHGPLEPGRAFHITRQVLMALVRAHGLGIVHRDLKPENVMLVTRDGDPDFVKVLDFGIAKVPMGELAKARAGEKPTAALTQLGMVYGTPEYMAPEQALGQDVDVRADLYAVGVMLYEMLCGRRPFEADSPVQLLGMVVSMPVPRLATHVPTVPAELENVTMCLLEKLAKDRYADARTALEALDAAMGYQAAAPASMSYADRTGARQALTSAAQLAALGQPAKGPSRQVLAMAGGVAVLLVLLIGVVIATRGGGESGKGPASSATASASAAPGPADSAVTDEEVRAAAQKGVSALSALRERAPRDPRVLRALARAHLDAKSAGDAIKAWSDLIEVDPSAASDKSVREGVMSAASQESAADQTLPVLEAGLGELGPDVLYDLTLAKGGAKVAKRAQESIDKPAVIARASKALKVALELRAARRLTPGEACRVRRELFARAKEEGDARALPYLSELTSTRGCGFLRRGDCFPCLHGDGLLTEAISTVRARPAGGLSTTFRWQRGHRRAPPSAFVETGGRSSFAAHSRSSATASTRSARSRRYRRKPYQ